MGLFELKKIEDITDIEELFVALAKRRHRNRIPPEILSDVSLMMQMVLSGRCCVFRTKTASVTERIGHPVQGLQALPGN